MSDKPENPSAFPRHYGTSSHADRQEQLWHGGMTLRDFFAAAALEGCVEKQFSDDLLARLGSTAMGAAAIASAAYEVADACLAARQGGTDALMAAIKERDALLAAAVKVEQFLRARVRHHDSLGSSNVAQGLEWGADVLRDAIENAREEPR